MGPGADISLTRRDKAQIMERKKNLREFRALKEKIKSLRSMLERQENPGRGMQNER